MNCYLRWRLPREGEAAAGRRKRAAFFTPRDPSAGREIDAYRLGEMPGPDSKSAAL